MSDDKRRFIIVGTGRSGSSLLASIVADAGADFDMPSRKQWDRESGAYEHPLLVQAFAWYKRGEALHTGLIPFRIVRFCQRRARTKLRNLFNNATFAKYPIATKLVHEIRSQGFQPVVLVSYRPFDSFAVSMWRRHGTYMKDLVDNYVDTYKTTLLQLRICGGCVVDYEDMVNPTSVRWIDALAETTGLDRDKLATARDNRLKEQRVTEDTPAYWHDMMAMDDRPEKIYNILKSLDGQVIPPLK